MEKRFPPKKGPAAKAKPIQIVERGVQPPKSLTWVPTHYMPLESANGVNGWSTRTSSYALEWSGSNATEEMYRQVQNHFKARKKAARGRVLSNGDIDATLEEKNVWDELGQNLIPKILDLSMVEWTKQKPAAMQKLHNGLDTEFEYINNLLSTIAFQTIITRYLKLERSWLKEKWSQGVEACLICVNGD